MFTYDEIAEAEFTSHGVKSTADEDWLAYLDERLALFDETFCSQLEAADQQREYEEVGA